TEPRRADMTPAPRLTDSPGATLSREVTPTLPASVYEDLQQHAHRRGKPLADLLREAIDTYLQGKSAAETKERTR
ncbi:MAG: ribbon-helix-helix protein, CopG family, partial [Candidatus Tectomicrobia bacterium]|nr:ribbon-helix-helix protein, CopG family [Candidatus Tectomicrobia bacterium]